MFLIAREGKNWQAGMQPITKQRLEASRNFAGAFSQTERQHGYETSIKNGFVHLHREMDPQDCFR